MADERLDESTEELAKVMREDEVRDAAFVILFTKKDIDPAKRMSEEEMVERMKLHHLMKGRKYWTYYSMSAFDESVWTGAVVSFCFSFVFFLF